MSAIAFALLSFTVLSTSLSERTGSTQPSQADSQNVVKQEEEEK